MTNFGFWILDFGPSAKRRTCLVRNRRNPKSKIQNLKLSRRRGAAALDYALVLGTVLPLLALTMWEAPKIMSLVYEMDSLLISWPFM
jgi:hypothetical protein